MFMILTDITLSSERSLYGDDVSLSASLDGVLVIDPGGVITTWFSLAAVTAWYVGLGRRDDDWLVECGGVKPGVGTTSLAWGDPRRCALGETVGEQTLYGCDGTRIGDTQSDVDDTCSVVRLVGVNGGVESFIKS